VEEKGPPMKKIANLFEKISAMGGVLAGLMMCLGLGLVVCEIILRSAFNITLYVTEEYSGYLMAMLTFCALGYTLREGGHIRMTFLHKSLTGKARVYLDLLCFFTGFLFCLSLTYYTGVFFWDSFTSGTRSMQISETYLAIPQFFLPFGSLILTLQFFGEMMKSLLVLTGDPAVPEAKSEARGLGR
jgi:TRAP-type C4-dicarboxylate transport system permease small subunit